jgi:hypothetical protein
MQSLDLITQSEAVLSDQDNACVARMSRCQHNEVANIICEEAPALGCRPEKLAFIAGVQRHPLAWSARNIVTERGQSFLQGLFRSVGIQVQLRLSHAD